MRGGVPGGHGGDGEIRPGEPVAGRDGAGNDDLLDEHRRDAWRRGRAELRQPGRGEAGGGDRQDKRTAPVPAQPEGGEHRPQTFPRTGTPHQSHGAAVATRSRSPTSDPGGSAGATRSSTAHRAPIAAARPAGIAATRAPASVAAASSASPRPAPDTASAHRAPRARPAATISATSAAAGIVPAVHRPAA